MVVGDGRAYCQVSWFLKPINPQRMFVHLGHKNFLYELGIADNWSSIWLLDRTTTLLGYPAVIYVPFTNHLSRSAWICSLCMLQLQMNFPFLYQGGKALLGGTINRVISRYFFKIFFGCWSLLCCLRITSLFKCFKRWIMPAYLAFLLTLVLKVGYVILNNFILHQLCLVGRTSFRLCT